MPKSLEEQIKKLEKDLNSLKKKKRKQDVNDMLPEFEHLKGKCFYERTHEKEGVVRFYRVNKVYNEEGKIVIDYEVLDASSFNIENYEHSKIIIRYESEFAPDYAPDFKSPNFVEIKPEIYTEIKEKCEEMLKSNGSVVKEIKEQLCL